MYLLSKKIYLLLITLLVSFFTICHSTIDLLDLEINATFLYKIKHCGYIYLINQDFVQTGHLDKKIYVTTGIKNFDSKKKTKITKIFINYPSSTRPTVKEVTAFLDEYFLESVKNNIKTQIDREIEKIKSTGDQRLIHLVETIAGSILNDDDGLNTKKEIIKLIKIYPQMFEEMSADEDSDLRPILDRHLFKMKKTKIIHRSISAFGKIVAVFGISAIIFCTAGTFIPELIIIAGALSFTSGSMDLALAMSTWKHKMESKEMAKKFVLLKKELDKKIDDLKEKAKKEGLSETDQAILETIEYLLSRPATGESHICDEDNENKIRLSISLIKLVFGPFCLLSGLHLVPQFVEFFAFLTKIELPYVIGKKIKEAYQ